jgi:hypothetical protein
MDGGLENMSLWIPVAHVSWPELLYGSPTSPSCFRVLDVLDSCGIWLVAFLCVCFVLMVIAFLIVWSLMSRLWDLMVYLTPFLVSWDEFVNMLIELLCWFTILFLWCLFWFFLCWSLESLSPFCSSDHTCSFRWAYISRHAFYGDLMTSFMNRILHHANPHDKLSVLCVSKSWVPKYSLTNHLRFKTWTSLSLSLLSYAGWRRWNGGHELWRSQFLLGVIKIRVVLHMLVHGVWFLVLYCDFFTSLWAFSYTLSLCLLEIRNCSCAHLIS